MPTTKWEYCERFIHDHEHRSSILREIGLAGWELACIEPSNGQRAARLTFKRPLVPSEGDVL